MNVRDLQFPLFLSVKMEPKSSSLNKKSLGVFIIAKLLEN